jgi:hypothetical protein
MPAPTKAPPQKQAPAPATAGRKHVSFGAIAKDRGTRIAIYGPGGIGKTTLAATAPGPVAFIDLDESLAALHDQLNELELRIVQGIETWQDLRDVLQGDGWDEIKTIVLDTGTKAEELATAHVVKTIPGERDRKCERIEDYGYGKGYTYLYDTFITLLSDLDQHVRAGRNIVLVCHDCVTMVPNPDGEDYQQYQPRLSSPASGKSSIRLRVREWVDHLLFVGYNVTVKDNKAKANGSRTIYPVERPLCMAKSRSLTDAIPLAKYSTELWKQLFGE